MTEQINVDVREFPLVITTYPTLLELEAVDPYMDRMTEVAERGLFALVADIRNLSIRRLDPAVRKRFFERAIAWDAGPGYRRKISEAIVLEGWVTRAIAAAYVWQVQPKGFDLRLMGTVEEAKAWSLSKLDARHLRVSA